jgi:hypothetical protein
MGNKIAIQTFYAESFLPDLAAELNTSASGLENLSTGRFLKTLKLNTDEGTVVAKIFPKRSNLESLRQHADRLAG